MKQMRKLKKGNVVEVELDDDGTTRVFHAAVKDLTSDWAHDPYNCIRVAFLDDDTRGYVQPWELIFDEEQTPGEIKMLQLSEYFLGEIRQVSNVRMYGSFQNCRSPENQKRLIREARFPSDLQLIAQRLENSYYATVESLIADVRQIGHNAKSLGQKTDVAKGLVSKLVRRIGEFARQLEMPIRETLETSDDSRGSSQ
jgi:hypothetical protein